MKQYDHIFTYLKWRGDLTFAADGPNAVDALIFAELVYLDFDGIVPTLGKAGGITIRDAARRYFLRYHAEDVFVPRHTSESAPAESGTSGERAVDAAGIRVLDSGEEEMFDSHRFADDVPVVSGRSSERGAVDAAVLRILDRGEEEELIITDGANTDTDADVEADAVADAVAETETAAYDNVKVDVEAKTESDKEKRTGAEENAAAEVDLAEENAAAGAASDVRAIDKRALDGYTKDERLLLALAASRRYGELYLDSYVDEIDMVLEKQFAAMRIHLSEWSSFIAYRGTDSTLVGWKENFNMSYQFPVPAQEQAAQYLDLVAVHPQGNYYICGHSKGGSLALYAAVYCREQVQEHIRRVYMFDAPGFYRDIWKEPEFERISDRVESYVPETSIVGVLLGYYPRYRVVRSSGSGVFQHDPYTWMVDGPDFSYAKERDHYSRAFEENVGGWISRIPLEQRKPFVDAFFEILAATGLREFSELQGLTPVRLAGIIRNLSSLSSENRDTLFRILRQVLR